MPHGLLRSPAVVGLAAETATGWRLVPVASSYRQFQELGQGREAAAPDSTGSAPDDRALLHSATPLVEFARAPERLPYKVTLPLEVFHHQVRTLVRYLLITHPSPILTTPKGAIMHEKLHR